ncbi:MAG: hypothetical protein AAGN35_09960 [Bacteroidota bacterium]
MKRALFTLFLALLASTAGAQNERLAVDGTFHLALQPYQLTGVYDINSDGETISNRPEWRTIDTTGWVGAVYMTFSLRLPLLDLGQATVGISPGLGGGYQFGIAAAQGLTSPLRLDFPAWLYLRSYGDRPWGIGAGYKYTISPLNHGLWLARFEIEVDDNAWIQFYGSFIRQTYYTQFTNGELRPAIRIPEFGISFVRTLGGGR